MALSNLEAFQRGFAGIGAESGPATSDLADPSADAVTRAIGAAIEAGQGAWPALRVPVEPFVTALGRCARQVLAAAGGQGPPPSALGVATVVANLVVADLYLACAAGHGDPAAVEIVTAVLIPSAVGGARRSGDSPAFIDELAQILKQKLLVPAEDARPRILTFSGRAPLAAWIAVVAQRTVSSLRRSEGRREKFERRAAIEADVAEKDPELGYIKAHYAEPFARAFEHALRGLTDRERSLLRLHNIHGVTLPSLAGVYGVDDSTISRWLARARAALVEETGRHLREAIGISASEVPSLVRALTSQVDVSLNRWLVSSSTSAR